MTLVLAAGVDLYSVLVLVPNAGLNRGFNKKKEGLGYVIQKLNPKTVGPAGLRNADAILHQPAIHLGKLVTFDLAPEPLHSIGAFMNKGFLHITITGTIRKTFEQFVDVQALTCTTHSWSLQVPSRSFPLCTSLKPRLFWLGMISCLQLIKPETYIARLLTGS